MFPISSVSQKRVEVSKLQGAQRILTALGLPRAQRSPSAAYTLLALANISPTTSWKEAERRSLRIHDILIFIKNTYGKTYAENTRETIRRQVLHQFEQAFVVDRNPDDLTLPTNSPRTHYAISESVLPVLKSFGKRQFKGELLKFQMSKGTLLKVYQAARARNLVPVTLPSGEAILLSPGKHNKLQAEVIKEFAPRFSPGAVVLYLGDAAKKSLHFSADELQKLGVNFTEHDKLPDVVILSKEKKWLYLIEAVTSHGPVSHKRKHELELFLSKCRIPRVYVSAFPSLSEFKRHIQEIAWETEVWIAEMPDHLIHFNGDRFLGPR